MTGVVDNSGVNLTIVDNRGEIMMDAQRTASAAADPRIEGTVSRRLCEGIRPQPRAGRTIGRSSAGESKHKPTITIQRSQRQFAVPNGPETPNHAKFVDDQAHEALVEPGLFPAQSLDDSTQINQAACEGGK